MAGFATFPAGFAGFDSAACSAVCSAAFAVLLFASRSDSSGFVSLLESLGGIEALELDKRR